MTNVFSWQNSAFVLVHFVFQGQTCLLFQISLDLLHLHFRPHDEKDIFFLVLVPEGLVGLQRIIPSSVSSALVVGAQTWITMKLNGLP